MWLTILGGAAALVNVACLVALCFKKVRVDVTSAYVYYAILNVVLLVLNLSTFVKGING